jgi:hypothetical protein
MSDPQPPQSLDRLRSHFHTGETPIPRPDCLDADTVAALADGTLDAARRARALGHVATCALCRRAVASVAEALADGPITHEVEIVEGRRSRSGRLLWITIPLAAAAALVVLVSRSGTKDSGGGLPVLRDSTIAGEPAPVLIAPRDRVDRVDRFVWSSVSKASRYRIRLYTDDGALLWNSETADTALPAPRSPALASGTPYFWMVEAQTEWQRWTASKLVEFRVVGARR